MDHKTNTETAPNIITGFRPYRSASIPQRTDVRALPNINEEPKRVRDVKPIRKPNTWLFTKKLNNNKLAYKSCIVTYVLLPFCNVQVPYLQNVDLRRAIIEKL